MMTTFSNRSRIGPRLAAFCLLATLPGSGLASAEELCKRDNPHMDRDSCPSYAFYWENDTLGGDTDRYYTNGLQWSREFKTTGEPEDSPFWVRRIHKQLKEKADGAGVELDVYRGLLISSTFYTPENLEDPDLIPTDRPYAGWTRGTSLLNLIGPKSQHRFEASLGVVGELALGEVQQKFAHEFISPDSPKPLGWDHQLDNEPALQFLYTYRRRVSPRRAQHYFDFTPFLEAAAGNVMVSGGAGFTARLGFNLPSGYATTIPAAVDGSGLHGELSFYVFVESEGRAVARYIFLDGNTFADSHSVDKETWVGEAKAGFALRCGRWTLTYQQLTRTEEFDLQDGRQTWGSVSLGVSPRGSAPFCLGKKSN